MNLQTNDTVPVGKKYLHSMHEASDCFSTGAKKPHRLTEENWGRFTVYSRNRYCIIYFDNSF